MHLRSLLLVSLAGFALAACGENHRSELPGLDASAVVPPAKDAGSSEKADASVTPSSDAAAVSTDAEVANAPDAAVVVTAPDAGHAGADAATPAGADASLCPTPGTGTLADPFCIPAAAHTVFTDRRTTADSSSSVIDTYPPSAADESGPEYFYKFHVGEPMRFTAEVKAPEPSGVDVDVHLLSALSPQKLVVRDDKVVYATLQPGDYFLSLDSYKGMKGAYVLDVTFRPLTVPDADTFNHWILEAVTELFAGYGLKGYSDVALTHDLAYGTKGTISAMAPPRTMCVAAVLEVLVTAMQIYARETGDQSVFDFLPLKSWQSLSTSNIRAHIWVNPDIEAGGTADAVRHFGMGMTVPFEELTPGSVLNLNRTTGSGHAVVFLAFLDLSGKEYASWNSNVVGFKYFSSQGGYDPGAGGFDYRWAVFSTYGTPAMPGKRDVNVIYSTDQTYLNTGIVYAPWRWLRTSWSDPSAPRDFDGPEGESVFDPVYFDGKTIDDDVR